MEVPAINSIFDLKEKYSQEPEELQNARMLNTVFTRFLVPLWGGNVPKGKRASDKDLEVADKFLIKIPTEHLADATEDLEKILVETNVSNQSKRVYRSVLKKFIDWVNDNKYLDKQEEKTKKTKLNLKASKGFSRVADWNHYSPHGIKFKKPYTLCAKDRYGELLFSDDYINPTLKQEVIDFVAHRTKLACSKATILNDTQRIHQILGWLHRYKGENLSGLCLTSIIPYCQLGIDFNQIEKESSTYLIKKYELKQIADNIAIQAIQLIEEYFAFLGCHPRSERNNLTSIMAVAKFIYRHELSSNNYTSENDIPIIKHLKTLTESVDRRSRVAPPTVPYTAKSVPWTTAIQALERLRIESDQELQSNRRRKNSLFNSLQLFLSLAFMVVIPPLRPRAFYELEIGKTFVKGIFKNSVFVPELNLKNPSEAQWHIHLMPTEYKTGKTYGEFWEAIPNVEFPDGKRLYEYIDLWLNEGREYGGTCTHNYFFRRKLTYEQLGSHAWRQRLERAFFRLVGVPVSPKELRKMYVTYLKDDNATETELEAAAAAMQHSREMQSRIYDQQTQINKIAPMAAYNEKKLKEIWETTGILEEYNHQKSDVQKTKIYTRHNYPATKAKKEVALLKNSGMSDEQIIQYLWGINRREWKKFKEAMMELEELLENQGS